jgi:cysteine desulfurase
MEVQPTIYFDNNATTRVAPEVLDAMLPYLRDCWGNPSSAYWFGRQLGQALDEARERVARLINADPREIVFTSCGTESNNSALHSALVARPAKKHILTTRVEHSATIKFCEFLQKQGFEVTYLPVNERGELDLALLRKSIREDTAIVSVMWANNETGILFPVKEIAGFCREKGVLFHTDAVQAAGKLPTDVKEAGIDLLSLSGHKLHAPKGIAALYIRKGVKFQPYLVGGNQEGGRRGGTENVAGIVGFGTAAELARGRVATEQEFVRALRDHLETRLLQCVPGTTRNGAAEPRLPNTCNLAFGDIEAEGVLLLLDQAGICASSGSACTTGSLDPSHVLTAMGCSAARARSSIRLSLSTYTTPEEVEYVIQQLPPIIEKLREHSVLRG